VAALFASTLGWVVATGALPGPLAARMPGAGFGTAAAVFVAGSIAIAALAYGLAAAAVAAARRRAG
jgi:alkylation response protein AidB-like acyl-CoA dehydrogenase